MAFLNPFTRIPTPDEAEKQAAKRTAKLCEQAGMFADYVEPVTPDQIIVAAEQHRDKFQRCLEEQQAKGDAARAEIAKLVGPEELASLDARRAVLPPGPEYNADFFCRELRRLLGGAR